MDIFGRVKIYVNCICRKGYKGVLEKNKKLEFH